MTCFDWAREEERLRREREEMARKRRENSARFHAEMLERLDGIESRWQEGEKERRREWEALEGRMLTAEEKGKLFWDGLFRKMTVMTNEYIQIMREISEENRNVLGSLQGSLERELGEGRAQLRANTEAVLKALDRLPPTDGK